MRDLIVFAIVILTLPTAFRKPFVGLLLFSWLAYMRPQDLCWSFARNMRFSFYVGVTMIVGWMVYESGKRRFVRPEPRSYMLILLTVFISGSVLFADVNSIDTGRYFFEFVKIMVISLFTLSQVDSKNRLRLIVWVISGSLAFYAFKNGLVGILRGGAPITRGPGGMMEDNNDFALALVMNIPLLHYMSTIEANKQLRKLCLVGVFFTMVTVLLLTSRGGFLAMAGALLWIAFRSGRIIQASIALLGLVIAFFTLAPDFVIERIMSIGEAAETDSSALSRLESWAVGWRMFADNPFWGVGLRNFILNAQAYGMTGTAEQLHVAHNSFIQVAAEGGGLAFVTYMCLLFSVFVSTNWIRRATKSRPDLKWARQYANMFETVTVAFMIGGTFLNRGHFDLIYHIIALVGCTTLIVRAGLRKAPETDDPEGAKPHRREDASVTVRPVIADGVMPRWERVT